MCLAASALLGQQHTGSADAAGFVAPRVFCGPSAWTDDHVVMFIGAPGKTDPRASFARCNISYDAGMELPADALSAYKYPLRQRTHIFLLSEVLHLTLETHILLNSASLSSFFENSFCSESLSRQSLALEPTYQSYRLVVEMRSTGSEYPSFQFINFWHLNMPTDYAPMFEYDMILRPFTINPFSIGLYLERDVIMPPLTSDDATPRLTHTQSISLLNATSTLHVAHCDMRWLPLYASSDSLEVGSLMTLSTNCTVPISDFDGNDTDDAIDIDITFECYVSGAVAFAVNAYLDRKLVTSIGSQRVAHHTYIVELPLRSTGIHILKSKITYFNGHGQAELGSPKVASHFPVAHLLQDYSIEPLQVSRTSYQPLPRCAWQDFFDADVEVASLETYWLNVDTCSGHNLPPHDQQRCSSFETMCNRQDPIQAGNNGAFSALERLCASAWLIAFPHCVPDLALRPKSLILSTARDNVARISTRYSTVAFYGSSIQDMNMVAFMELLGVPIECLRFLGALYNDNSNLANCVFFSHATNSSASIHGDDVDAVMRVKKIAQERKSFSITSASHDSSLKGLNVSFLPYPLHCNGEASFCAADNLPAISRIWPAASGAEVDLGVEKLGQDIRYCSTNTCPLCVEWSHCFQKDFTNDIQNVSGGSPVLVLVEIPIVSKRSLFISNLNTILHALADSLAKGSCVILVNGHGLHSNRDIDRKFPMRANVGSRMQSFDSMMSRIWRKGWSVHQGHCKDDIDTEPRYASDCSDDINAAGLIRLLAVLGPAVQDVSEDDVCHFGVAKINTYAFGSGRPDASRDGVHYYAESGNKKFRMGNEVVLNVAAALMTAMF